MILQEKLLMQEQGGECDQESNPTADNRRWGTVHKKKCCLSQEDKLWLGNKKKDSIVRGRLVDVGEHMENLL